MTIIDRSQLDRQFAIVDMIKELPAAIAWAAISNTLPLDAQIDLYDFLHDIESQRHGHCSTCHKALGEDDIDLCASCGDRSEQLANMQQMMGRSGVVFGEHL